MRSKSVVVKSTDELNDVILKFGSEDFSPSLAFVFTSLEQDWNSIGSILKQADIQLFGATSFGAFVRGEYDYDSVAVLFLDMDPATFHLELFPTQNDNLKGSVRKLAEKAKAKFDHPCFIISAAHISIQSVSIIEAIQEVCGPDVTIIGGNASSSEIAKGFVFNYDEKHEMGLQALIIDEEKIKITGEATSGWKPIGTVKTVTKCEGNWIYTIDDEPALNHLIKYIGADIDFSNEEDLYEKIGNIYPLQVMHDDGTSTIIPPLFFNEQEKSFMLATPIEVGTKIRFSLPPDFDVIDTVIESAEYHKKNCMEDADALLIFSCAGRNTCLGPMVADEIKGLVDVWDVPSIGFFTYGEYGKVRNGKPRFHGTTVSWAALKEK